MTDFLKFREWKEQKSPQQFFFVTENKDTIHRISDSEWFTVGETIGLKKFDFLFVISGFSDDMISVHVKSKKENLICGFCEANNIYKVFKSF